MRTTISDKELAELIDSYEYGAIKDALRELQRLREEQQQWEPQWESINAANAEGYNEAMRDGEELQRLRAALKAAHEKSLEYQSDSYADGYTACLGIIEAAERARRKS